MMISQGHTPGTPANLTDEARQKTHQTVREKARANKNNRQAAAMIALCRQQGLTWLTIAHRLNKAGFHPSRGKQFQAIQVQRLHWRQGQ
jgi:hypothetical protein